MVKGLSSLPSFQPKIQIDLKCFPADQVLYMTVNTTWQDTLLGHCYWTTQNSSSSDDDNTYIYLSMDTQWLFLARKMRLPSTGECLITSCVLAYLKALGEVNAKLSSHWVLSLQMEQCSFKVLLVQTQWCGECVTFSHLATGRHSICSLSTMLNRIRQTTVFT